jgi:hypothetical protein
MSYHSKIWQLVIVHDHQPSLLRQDSLAQMIGILGRLVLILIDTVLTSKGLVFRREENNVVASLWSIFSTDLQATQDVISSEASRPKNDVFTLFC